VTTGPRVAVVTDSTAALPPHVAAQAGVVVVPLDVLVDGTRHDAGSLTPGALLDALKAGARVSTSQPPPAAFADAYAAVAAAGATEIVSVHLSGALSGTVEAARLAGGLAPVPVRVVDARTAAMALGFAALAAARVASALPVPQQDEARGFRAWVARLRAGRVPVAGPAPQGPTGEQVAAEAERVAAGSRVWFLVDSLEHLRRGGRLGAAAAALGTVLGLRPILTVREGGIVVAERVRTRRAARERLVAIAAADAATRAGDVRLAVHHLGMPDLGAGLAEQLVARVGRERVAQSVVSEADAVLAAHVGPGLLAVVVADV
jgi:fatty acid-binding protein DegV